MKNFTRAVTVLVSSAALVGASLMGAAGATAAPGDVSEVGLAAASTPRDVAEGPDGNMWVTGGASNTIAKVSMTGGVTAYALPLPANVSNPWSIAAGPDGNMWFTLRTGGKIGRITTSGAVSLIDLPDASMQPQDITAGPGNNMWFTELGGRIGRVTMAGAVTMFTVPWANSQPHSIAAGPASVDGLYFTDSGADRVGFVVSDGSIYPNQVLIADSAPSGIVNVDDSMWFVMSGTNKLAKILQRDALLETSVVGAPTAIAKGIGNTMWISLSARNSVAKYSVQGAPLAEYPLTSPNSLPAGLAEGPDTNVWVAQTNAGKIARVLSGQVPVATSAPSITPATGVKAGTTVTATEGTWDYAPTTYTYQWQACSNGADANSCANIAGATSKTYVATAQNTNQYLRVGVQAVNGSGPGSPSYSSLVGVGTIPPPTPTPVTGGQTVTLAEGVTLNLKSVKRTRTGVKRSFAVIANTSNIKGKVRISIVDAAGRERQVVAKGRWLKPLGAN
ncbi:MAG: hypothetical protein VX327_05775, partial [Actinomycetota bacterium]|nr:hypothetical protein [Actinomycetota bacterium]